MGYFEERNKKLIDDFTKRFDLPRRKVKDLVENRLAPDFDPNQKLHELLNVGTFSEQLELKNKVVNATVDIDHELTKIRKVDSQVRALTKLTGWPVEKVAQIRSHVLDALSSIRISNSNDCDLIVRAVFRELSKKDALDFLLNKELAGLLSKIKLFEYGIEYVATLPDLPMFQETCKRIAAHLADLQKESMSSDSPPKVPPGLTQCCLSGKIPFALDVLNLIGDTKVPFDFSELCCKFLLVAFRHFTLGEISQLLDTNESEPTAETTTDGSLFAIPYQDFTICQQKTPLGELFSFLLDAGSMALHQRDGGKLSQPGPKGILKKLKGIKSLGQGGHGYFALYSKSRLQNNINAFLDAAKTTAEELRRLKAEAKTIIRTKFINQTTKGSHIPVRKKKPMSKDQTARAKWMLKMKKKKRHGDPIDDKTLAKIFTNPDDFPANFRPPKNNFGLPPLCSKQAVGQALKRYKNHLASVKGSTKR